MTLRTTALILGILIVATTLEVTGDAIVRMGLDRPTLGGRIALFAAGAALLFGYGLLLNLAPIAFHRVVGIYIATLFVVWQGVSYVTFRSLPTLPILAGGALIVAGGLVVAFWRAGEIA